MHTAIAVLARVVMEALQHLRRWFGQEFPTVLVLEEAHHFVLGNTFVLRDSDDSGSMS